MGWRSKHFRQGKQIWTLVGSLDFKMLGRVLGSMVGQERVEVLVVPPSGELGSGTPKNFDEKSGVAEDNQLCLGLVDSQEFR